MNEFPENEVQTPETPTEPPAEPESTYRYTRPVGESFTDASDIPHDQAPRTPRTHSYAEPELRESRRSWEAEERRRNEAPRRGLGAGAVIALCLVCVLVGAAAGLIGAGIGSRAAVGVDSLPGDAPVEISIIAAAGKEG